MLVLSRSIGTLEHLLASEKTSGQFQTPAVLNSSCDVKGLRGGDRVLSIDGRPLDPKKAGELFPIEWNNR